LKANIKKISELSGFSPATVSNALNNKKGVNHDTAMQIIAIAKALGTTPGYLMGWENETAPSAESLEDLVLAKRISRMPSDSKKLVIDLINKLSGE